MGMEKKNAEDSKHQVIHGIKLLQLLKVERRKKRKSSFNFEPRSLVRVATRKTNYI